MAERPTISSFVSPAPTRVVPIKPEDIPSQPEPEIPEFVIDIFNELIIKNYDYDTESSKIMQEDAVIKIVEHLCPDQHDRPKEHVMNIRKRIFKEKWLDVENMYRDKEWIVEFDKPAWCETYPAFFVFSKPKHKKRKR